eukprot:224040_1
MSRRPRNQVNKAKLNVKKGTDSRCRRWVKVLEAFCIKPWSSNQRVSNAFQKRLERGPMVILEMMKNEWVFFSILLKEAVKIFEIGIDSDKIMHPDFMYNDMLLCNDKLKFFKSEI